MNAPRRGGSGCAEAPGAEESGARGPQRSAWPGRVLVPEEEGVAGELGRDLP